jgi:adenylate cyclase
MSTAALVTGLVVVAGVWSFFAFLPGALEYLDAVASDFEIYHFKPARPSGDVVIAAIDDASIAHLGRWPWSRNTHANLLKALREYQAAVVGFDVVFSEPGTSSGDLSLAHAIATYKPTYIGFFFSDNLSSSQTGVTSYRSPPLDPPPLSYKLVRKVSSEIQEPPSAVAYLPSISELNRASAGAAYLNIDEDVDGAVRSFPTVFRFRGIYCVPFFLAMADAYRGKRPLSLTLNGDGVAEVSAANRSIPTDEAGKMTLHYRGPAGTIPRYSAADIIAGRLPSQALTGKVVVVGVTAAGLGDRFATPVGNNFPGVEIQANAIDEVIAGDFIRASSKTTQQEIVLGLVAGVIMVLAGAFLHGIASLTLTLVLASICSGYSVFRLVHDGTFVGAALPLSTLTFAYLAVVSSRYISEGREKRYLRSVFELYLSRDVIASILNDPAALSLGGQRRHLSILFADIVNFTSRAESTDPQILVAFLNTYMTTMTNVILEHRGVVDKLMGDGIMAFWGAPIPSDNPARQALQCALKMHEHLQLLARRDSRFCEVEIGIGIATGEAIVGNMGGENRFDYSAVGDTVNLASRLEGLTRIFGTRILVDSRTIQECGGGFVAREIGLVRVKGKQQLVTVVEVGSDVDAAYFACFAGAAQTLRTGGSPEPELRRLLEERPDDQVVTMWLERLPVARSPNYEISFDFDANRS